MRQRPRLPALPSGPAALIQATRALQEALGSLAQRALCSADPAAVSEAVALVARLTAAVQRGER